MNDMEFLREKLRPAAADKQALDEIANLLHGREWTPASLDVIAELVRDTGRPVDDVIPLPAPPATTIGVNDMRNMSRELYNNIIGTVSSDDKPTFEEAEAWALEAAREVSRPHRILVDGQIKYLHTFYEENPDFDGDLDAVGARLGYELQLDGRVRGVYGPVRSSAAAEDDVEQARRLAGLGAVNRTVTRYDRPRWRRAVVPLLIVLGTWAVIGGVCWLLWLLAHAAEGL